MTRHGPPPRRTSRATSSGDVDAVTGANTAEIRQRRIDEALALFGGGQER